VAEQLQEEKVLPIEYDKIEDELTAAFGKKVVFAIRDMWKDLVEKINPLIRSYYVHEPDLADTITKAHTQNTDTKIIDADGDTQIQVEESADEDKIRMDVKGAEAFLLSDAGVLTLVKQSGSRAIALSAQAVAAGVAEDVEIDSVSADYCFDNQGEVNTTNHDHTVSEDGQYLIIGNVAINDIDDGNYLIGYINVNDAIAGGRTHVESPAANADLSLPVADILELDANDYINLVVVSQQALDTNVGGYRGFLAVWKLG